MFWGLIMEPQRRYTQKVKKSFHISMAALDISTSSDEPAQVMCGFEGRNYLLCTLKKPDTMQVPLDLNFKEGDELSFAANGKCHIHLTGYLVEEYPELEDLEEEEEIEEQEKVKKKNKKRNTKENAENGPPKKKSKAANAKEDEDEGSEDDDDEDDEDDNSDVDIKDLLGKSLDEDDNDESFMEEADEEEDDDDEEDEDDEDDLVEDEDVSSMSEADSEEEPVAKKEPKINGVPVKKQKPSTPAQNKQNKEAKTPKSAAKENQSPKEGKKEKKTPEKGNQTPSKKKVLQGGVIVEDLKEGQGPNAKNGKFVSVYYEGRLKQNNKLFDSTNKGNGFSFRLGAGEVIKGWDVGVVGMKVGGKRRITCPPEMAYGVKGSPPAIPANSTLVFEVEMKKIR